MAKLWLPDSRLEQPELFEAGRKPVGLVKIDFNHSMAEGLERFHMLKTFADRDYVTHYNGVPYDINAGQLVQHSDGVEFQGLGNNGAENGQIIVIPHVGSMPEGTIVLSVTYNALSNNQYIFSHSDYAAAARIYVFITSSNTLGVVLGAGGALSTTMPVPEKIRTVIAIAWSGTTASVCVGGSLYEDVYTFSSVPGSSDAYSSLGAYNDPGDSAGASRNGFSGILHHAASSSRRYSSKELVSISLDPYQFLIPA